MAIRQGREPYIGVGVETTPGTSVAATKFLPFVTCTLRGMHEAMEDDAAKGVRERVWGTIVGKQRGEGDVEIYVDAKNAPYLLIPALGTITSSTTSGPAFQHVITRKTGSTPKTLTVYYNDTQDTRKYVFAAINTLELTVSDGLATISANILSRFPTTGTASLAITEERILAFKDYTIKFGSGTTGATALTAANAAQATPVNNFTLRVNNNTQPIYTSGNASVQTIVQSQFEVDGEYTLFYESTFERVHYETLASGAAVRAMVVTFTGDPVGSNTEMIKVEIPHFYLKERNVDTAVSGFITENPSFVAEYDETVAYSARFTIRNSVASY